MTIQQLMRKYLNKYFPKKQVPLVADKINISDCYRVLSKLPDQLFYQYRPMVGKTILLRTYGHNFDNITRAIKKINYLFENNRPYPAYSYYEELVSDKYVKNSNGTHNTEYLPLDDYFTDNERNYTNPHQTFLAFKEEALIILQLLNQPEESLSEVRKQYQFSLRSLLIDINNLVMAMTAYQETN